MKIPRSFIAGVVLSFIALSFFSLIGTSKNVSSLQKLDNLPKYGSFETLVAPEYEPAVIIGDKDGHRFCSGTVIDNNYVLTASHCLYDGGLRLVSEKLTIFNSHGVDTKIVGKAVAINISMDHGLIKGNFTNFKKVQIDPVNMPFQDPNALYIACGFPAGQATLVCVRLLNLYPYYEQYSATAQFVPGMSGGAVLAMNPLLGSVVQVGIITALAGDIGSRPGSNVLVTGITGLLGEFEIEPKQEK